MNIVEKKVMRLREAVQLELGARLEGVEVAYEECGAPPTATNCVFICHALTGDAHVAGAYAGEDHGTGWWEGIVGPGRAIDTNRFHVVCANVLGGCKGTTGPASINPATGKAYGSSFPRFTMGDTVNVYRALLRELGITHLAALVGGSFGGMQVFDWISTHPSEVDSAIMIASGVALNSQALAFDIVGRRAITLDPSWQNGDYYDTPCKPDIGLAAARQVAHITYLSLDLLNRKFGRKLQQNWLDADADFRRAHERNFRTYFAIESYLDYQAEKFLARFDANSYLHITAAMDAYDGALKHGSMDEACARITSRLLLISLSGDWLFSASQSRDIASSMMRLGKSVSYSHLDVKVGHDGFLTHLKELSRIMGSFLAEHDHTAAITPTEQTHYRPILKMLRPNTRVLDIGCGSGTLMNILRAEKHCTVTGLDIDFDRIVDSVAAGNDTLYEDADENLSLVPDHSYDIAILSETLQAVRRPRRLIEHILRVADEAIVMFPNFAAFTVCSQLVFKGRMPMGKQMPFEWYNTPNIHFFTLKDFKALCAEAGIEIMEMKFRGLNWLDRLLLMLGCKNAGATRVIARLHRKQT